MERMNLSLASLAGLLLLAACDLRTGPVVGDWTGIEETIAQSYYAHLEVILDGTPDATSGTYHYVRLLQIDAGTTGPQELRWTDQWTKRVVIVDGRTLTMIHLDNLPNTHIPDFVLTDADLLVPVSNPSRPDLSRNAFLWALRPVPRGSFGYGRP